MRLCAHTALIFVCMGPQVGRYTGWDAGSKSAGTGLKLQERPIGKDGRVIPEVRADPLERIIPFV